MEAQTCPFLSKTTGGSLPPPPLSSPSLFCPPSPEDLVSLGRELVPMPGAGRGSWSVSFPSGWPELVEAGRVRCLLPAARLVQGRGRALGLRYLQNPGSPQLSSPWGPLKQHPGHMFLKPPGVSLYLGPTSLSLLATLFLPPLLCTWNKEGRQAWCQALEQRNVT